MYLFDPPADPEGHLVHGLLAVLEWGTRELVADFLGWAGASLPPGVTPADVRVHRDWRVGGIREDGALHVPGRFLLLLDSRGAGEGQDRRIALARRALQGLPYPTALVLLGASEIAGPAFGSVSEPGGLDPARRWERGGLGPARGDPEGASSASLPEPAGLGPWLDPLAGGGAGGTGPAAPVRYRSWSSLFAWLRRGQGRHPPGGTTYLLVDELCRLIEREGLVAFGGFRVDEFARAAEALPSVAPVLRAYFRLVDAVCDELEARGHEVEELEPPEDEEYALWEQGVLVARLLVDGGGAEGEAADDVEIDVTLDLEARALEVGLYLLPDRHPRFWPWVEGASLAGYEVRPLDPAERAEADEAGIVWSQPLDADLGLLAPQLVESVAGRTEALMRLSQEFLGG